MEHMFHMYGDLCTCAPAAACAPWRGALQLASWAVTHPSWPSKLPNSARAAKHMLESLDHVYMHVYA